MLICWYSYLNLHACPNAHMLIRMHISFSKRQHLIWYLLKYVETCLPLPFPPLRLCVHGMRILGRMLMRIRLPILIHVEYLEQPLGFCVYLLLFAYACSFPYPYSQRCSICSNPSNFVIPTLTCISVRTLVLIRMRIRILILT